MAVITPFKFLSNGVLVLYRLQIEREKFTIFRLFVQVPLVIIKRLAQTAEHNLSLRQQSLDASEAGEEDQSAMHDVSGDMEDVSE